METVDVTNTLNSYQLHDIVVSTVDNPAGTSSYKFKDKIGVVTGIEMIGSEQCYQVAFRYIKDLLFSAAELRYATDQEIRKELINQLAERIDAMW